MTLSEAIALSDEGYSIRNPDYGYQVLVPQGVSVYGIHYFRMSGTVDPPYEFTALDNFRTDWEAVGFDKNKVDLVLNPSLEEDFSAQASPDAVIEAKKATKQ